MSVQKKDIKKIKSSLLLVSVILKLFCSHRSADYDQPDIDDDDDRVHECVRE